MSLAAGESSMRGEVEFTLQTPEEAAEMWGRMGRTAGMGQQGWRQQRWGSRDRGAGMGVERMGAARMGAADMEAAVMGQKG